MSGVTDQFIFYVHLQHSLVRPARKILSTYNNIYDKFDEIKPTKTCIFFTILYAHSSITKNFPIFFYKWNKFLNFY